MAALPGAQAKERQFYIAKRNVRVDRVRIARRLIRRNKIDNKPDGGGGFRADLQKALATALDLAAHRRMAAGDQTAVICER